MRLATLQFISGLYKVEMKLILRRFHQTICYDEKLTVRGVKNKFDKFTLFFLSLFSKPEESIEDRKKTQFDEVELENCVCQWARLFEACSKGCKFIIEITRRRKKS